MKQIILSFVFFSFFFFLIAQSGFAQEETGIFKTNVQYKGNNTLDPEDVSGLPDKMEITAEEKQLINEIQQLRQADDRSKLNQILQLEDQLESLNPNSISKPAEYYGGSVAPGGNEIHTFIPEAIGNVEIFNSGSSFISSMATATEQIGATAGRIWVAFSIQKSGAADSLRVYYSDNNGLDWVWYAQAKLGGTDRINWDEMDMEIIENSSGEKYIWIVYGYRNDMVQASGELVA